MNDYYRQHLLYTASLTIELLVINKDEPNERDRDYKDALILAHAEGDVDRIVSLVEEAIKEGVSSPFWRDWGERLLHRAEVFRAMDDQRHEEPVMA